MVSNTGKNILAVGIATGIVAALSGFTWLGALHPKIAGPIAIGVAVLVFIGLFAMAIRSRL